MLLSLIIQSFAVLLLDCSFWGAKSSFQRLQKLGLGTKSSCNPRKPCKLSPFLERRDKQICTLHAAPTPAESPRAGVNQEGVNKINKRRGGGHASIGLLLLWQRRSHRLPNSHPRSRTRDQITIESDVVTASVEQVVGQLPPGTTCFLGCMVVLLLSYKTALSAEWRWTRCGHVGPHWH